MSLDHFKELYHIARTDGVSAALAYDRETTLERDNPVARAYGSFRRACEKNSIAKEVDKSWDLVHSEDPVKDLCLAPVKMTTTQFALTSYFAKVAVDTAFGMGRRR